MSNQSAPSLEQTKLSYLLKPFVIDAVLTQIPDDAVVSGLTNDSRKVKTGELFLACPGYQVDARQFIPNVIEQADSWVIAEAEGLERFNYTDKKIIAVNNLAEQLSAIAARYYGKPTSKQTVIGFTGTNGKTSCCFLQSQALDFLNHKTLMLSTLGNGDYSSLELSANTTPDAVTIQKMASKYLQNNYHYISMEVSSHGLTLKRVAAVDYKLAVFTNLSHEHLDFHGDMNSYYKAKRELFTKPELEFAIINHDDLYGKKLLEDQEIKAKKIAFSTLGKRELLEQGLDAAQMVFCENAQYTLEGISCDLYTPWGQAKLHSSLLGEFNLSNLLAVASCLGCLFGDIEKWIVALNQAKAVPGRMQSFISEKKANLVVDYAHTPDALEKALQAARAHCDGDIWCLFGCGGDRDNTKRSAMAKIAEQNADKIIITDDNPRTELATEIVSMIRAGFIDSDIPYISDRREAISFALNNATNDDLIFIAGKGHEDYQEIGTEKKHYSDLETVAELLRLSA